MATTPATKAAAPVAKAAPRKVETITLKSVSEQLAEDHDLPKKQVQSLMDGFVGHLTTHLKAGNRVQVRGIGILEVKDRPERMGRNPGTGAAIKIAASKKIAFRAAKELKEAV
jgi:DNA-binding protein HU-beta